MPAAQVEAQAEHCAHVPLELPPQLTEYMPLPQTSAQSLHAPLDVPPQPSAYCPFGHTAEHWRQDPADAPPHPTT